MKRLAIAAALLAGWTAGAGAQEARTLGRSGAANVFVWRDSDAHSEAVKLIEAGVHKTNAQLVLRLLSCLVPVGTKAVITDGGFFSSTILVTDGPDAGCRGDVANEDLGMN